MNEKNYDFLANQLTFTGFPDSMHAQLKEKMAQEDPAFVLTYQGEAKKDQVNATLFFKKSQESDMYFFNSYRLQVTPENNPNGIGQTFYISNKKFEEGQEKFKRDITLKEAYNLLAKADNKEEQRFVYGKWQKKNGETFNAWKGIDVNETDKNGNYMLKPYHDSYGFKPEKSLASLPIRESDKNDPELLRSLQKGNLVSVKNDAGEIMHISAYPPGRRINLFDKDMKLVNGKENQQSQYQTTTIRNVNGQTQGQAAVKENVASAANEPDGGMAMTDKKKVKHSVPDTGDDIEGVSERRSRKRGR